MLGNGRARRGLLEGSAGRRGGMAKADRVGASERTCSAGRTAPEPSGLVVLGSTKRELEQFAALEQRALGRYNQLVQEDKADADMVRVIEDEILPVWREAKTAALAIQGLPATLTRNLRIYVETRERAFVEIAESLRKQDGEAMKRGMATMREADGYIDKLQP